MRSVRRKYEHRAIFDQTAGVPQFWQVRRVHSHRLRYPLSRRLCLRWAHSFWVPPPRQAAATTTALSAQPEC
jgi:hypothetical protein